MSDEFNDFRTSLRQSVEAFRPELDAPALAKAGRVRSRVRLVVGGLAGTFALAGAALLVAPFLLGSAASVPAAPAPAPASVSPPVSTTKHPAMTTPIAGAVKPDSSWRTVSVPTANLIVSYPANWTVNENQWGIVSIYAPSGYAVGLLTNQLQASCDDGPLVAEPPLANTDIVATTSLGRGPVVIRWHNGGEAPASINLAQRSATERCWQKFLNYGGVDDVYLGSVDNAANPTASELDQAVAILASASRMH